MTTKVNSRTYQRAFREATDIRVEHHETEGVTSDPSRLARWLSRWSCGRTSSDEQEEAKQAPRGTCSVTLLEAYRAYHAASMACHCPPTGRPCTAACRRAWVAYCGVLELDRRHGRDVRR